MLNKNSGLIGRFILFIVLCVFPFHSYASEKRPSVYTIQVASLKDLDAAEKQFDSITEQLDKKELAFLRIEKVGKFYSLRIGKFDTKAEANELLESVKPKFPSSIVMEVYFIEDRIKRMYETGESVKEAQPAASPETGPAASEDKSAKTASTKEEIPLEEKIDLISSLVNKKEYENALDILNEEMAKQPDQPALNAWYGTVLLKMNKPEEALPHMLKAAELSPSVADYHNGVGYCYFYLNNYSDAISEFNKALSLDPNHVDAIAGLGIIYAKSGNREQSMEIYKRLKSLDKGSAEKLLKIIQDIKS